MANIKLYETIPVVLATEKYPVYIGQGLLSDEALFRSHVHGKSVLLVTNETIAPLYLATVQKAFSFIRCDVVVLPDGEAYKNQASLFALYDKLIDSYHHRDTTLVALGGGVIGDITGFAAATYQRGVAFLQFPTTLLSQVDASVGGKTAINHPRGKNMIGSFHQPNAVFIDIDTLATLPEREFRAGLAEILKYGLLMGGTFLDQLTHLLDRNILQASPEELSQLIANCCRIKAQFVQEDEREQGNRALLNLGHTFAHALETDTDYRRWLHGEAVAIGLYCAALLSHRLGYLSKDELNQVDTLLEKASLPRRIPKDRDAKRLQDQMLSDKKIQNNTLRFVVMRSLGECFLDDHITADVVLQVLKDAVE